MFVRKMLARALPLTALGLAAWCPAYAVEEPVKADDVYVTATRVEKELQDVPMSVSVMTSEDIKRSPARTIGELLQDVPGVEIRNSGGQGFRGCPACFLILKGMVISSHETNRFS